MAETTALTINDLSGLQIALLEDDNSAIRNYIERLDRETSNDAMAAAGVHFGFPVVEIEGVQRTSAGHLARVFGYKQTRSLADLLLRRGIEGVMVGGFERNTQIKIIEKLVLDSQDRKSILYDWPAFLIGGMNSQNDEAKAVQTYLLRMEKIARVGIVATRQGQLISNFPDAAHGIVMTKLCKEAWRGNALASYILEKHYDVPVKQLLHRTEPGLSELGGLISQYLHFVCEDKLVSQGLLVSSTENGFKVTGTPEVFYRAFLEIARRHHLTQFFSSVFSLGAIMARELDALEMLGWKRSVKKINGYSRYTYEYTAPQDSLTH